MQLFRDNTDEMKIKNFALIIGAMKCGTTSLFNILAQHPQVSPCCFKEPAFFAFNKRFSKGIDYYQSLWNWKPEQHKIALEASTGYTKKHFTDLNAAENIAKFKTKANFKFIYIIRNPIKRIESQCNHAISSENKKSEDMISNLIDLEIINTSKYSWQIAEYYERFSANDIMLLDFDDLKSISLTWIQGICRFLEINDSYEFKEQKNIYHDSSKKQLTKSWSELNIPMKKNISYLSSKMPFKYKQMIHNTFGSKRAVPFRLSEEQKRYIIAELKDDIQRLRINYEFDISKWGI
jgi:hypothetical protein